MNGRLEPHIRILLGSSIAIGPGKAALLEAISETGSIAAAGRHMGMSYRRAWLTATGREVLALYRAMEDHAAAAVTSDMERLRALMVDEPPEDGPADRDMQQLPYRAR